MSLFLDYLWIWIVLTFAVGGCGYTWYLNDQKGRTLGIAVAAPFFTLALGLTLYYGVDTDRKSIIRMLDALIAAVEKDDPDAVCQFISLKAEEVQKFVRNNMRYFKVSRAKYHSLKIAVNDATSPPSAYVQFDTVFSLSTKGTMDGYCADQPVPERVRFEIELVKTKDRSWLITSKFRYFPPRNFP
jgi:hypothetical protein